MSVDVLEVPCVPEHAQLARVADLVGRGCIARRDSHRDRVVAVAVQHELRDAEREALARRGEAST
jgi:hypothetical protein